MIMTRSDIKKIISLLLKHRPDLVIIKTESQTEKKTLVKILKNAGGKIIYRE
jgi:hypothetical protein